MRSASPQVHREPTMKISAPTAPPPSMLSTGFHSAEPRNSPRECPYTRNVSDPLYTKKAPITMVRMMTNRPQAVISPRQKYSFENIPYVLFSFIKSPDFICSHAFRFSLPERMTPAPGRAPFLRAEKGAGTKRPPLLPGAGNLSVFLLLVSISAPLLSS